jgi:hypothetical protein
LQNRWLRPWPRRKPVPWCVCGGGCSEAARLLVLKPMPGLLLRVHRRRHNAIVRRSATPAPIDIGAVPVAAIATEIAIEASAEIGTAIAIAMFVAMDLEILDAMVVPAVLKARAPIKHHDRIRRRGPIRRLAPTSLLGPSRLHVLIRARAPNRLRVPRARPATISRREAISHREATNPVSVATAREADEVGVGAAEGGVTAAAKMLPAAMAKRQTALQRA